MDKAGLREQREIKMKIFGMELYYFTLWFFAFSLFGYILECIVLTIEQKRLILNRGFTHGPFCIIYGFGAVGGYLLLKPICHNLVLLFICSSLLATVMELITSWAMIRLFGSFWWDYSQKAFNYKGRICLETSIGWGFLGIIFFYFLDAFMKMIVNLVPAGPGHFLAVFLFAGYVLDFMYCMIRRRRNPDELEENAVGRLKVVKE